jgi:UDP-N-acetylmuramyl tripeptide synthase
MSPPMSPPSLPSPRSARTALAVRAGRLAGRVSRRAGMGAGVTIGGRVALAVAPGVIGELAAGRGAVVVSGTNGKTTTTRLLVAALEASGAGVLSNDTGANLASGVASALAAGASGARPVLEVDEAALPRVIAALDPHLVVLTNLSRDQLDRYGEVGTVASRWRQMLASRPGQRVVANAADPLVVWAAQDSDTVWVDTGLLWREDATACPACGALLEWGDGSFRSACGFAMPEAAVRLAGDVVEADGDRFELSLSLPGRWNLANAAVALTAARELGVGMKEAAAAMSGVREVGGRQATWRLPDGRSARLLLAKNPARWTEVLRFLAGTDSGVVVALNCQVADGKDPSWLWDVPFELLAGRPVGASGQRHLDLAVRLRYAGVDFVDDPDPLRAAGRVGGDDVEVVATYSAFVDLVRRIGSLRSA